MPALENEMKWVGLSSTLMPPTRAALQSPRRNACTASASATSELEHAVSNGMLGPRRSNSYDTRLGISVVCTPVVRLVCYAAHAYSRW